MPYPPTYNEAWDITQPPDTQLANLLGSDIRNLKNDIMQRMALIAGPFANRPTPETTNATWGGVGFGILYFSTDNGHIYQWTGAGPAWADVTANFIPVGVNNVLNSQQLLAATTTSPAFTYTLPANTLINSSQGLRFKVIVSLSGTHSTVAINLVLGSGFIIMGSGNLSASGAYYYIDATLMYVNANAFLSLGWVNNSVGFYPNSYSQSSGSINFANPQTISLTFSGLTGGDTINPIMFLVEFIH